MNSPVKSNCHVVPIVRGQNSATITPPWFVNGSEYVPKLATFEPLVNGEQAFREVYRAIEAAEKSICIICWGFQPSMYFVRGGSGLMIGQLLQKKAEAGVMVRVLGWAWSNKPVLSLNTSKPAIGENNLPGRRWIAERFDRPETSSEQQYDYDRWWFYNYDRNPLWVDAAGRAILGVDDLPRDHLKFYSRAFGSRDSAQIAGTNWLDTGLSVKTKSALSTMTSHHQKTVVIDHEIAEKAVAFVMGHNMLDGYWDTDQHSYARRPENAGRNGASPLHDYSSRVTGPIVGDVFRNFAAAWGRETNEQLRIPAFETYPLHTGKAKAVCQILRTQPQYGKYDIMNCYLQAVDNAAQYIHIENQYFRWPPLAERIKTSAAKQVACGRAPEEHGALYVFVITNSSNTGMGSGTVNTYRMLESLGRSDTMPQVARTQRLKAIEDQLETNQDTRESLLGKRAALDSQARLLQGMPNPGLNERYAPINDKLAEADARQQELEAAKARLEKDTDAQAIRAEDVPGLKVHMATLVASDTPAGQTWPEVYIHAKLMLIDDAFMTLGSANINSRSMQADSEMNIAHHRPEITAPLRHQQWAKYTGGRVTAGMSYLQVFRSWTEILQENSDRKKRRQPPIAQLAAFLRVDPKISNID